MAVRSFAQHATTMFIPHFVGVPVRESRTSSAVLVIAMVATAVVLSAPVKTAVVPARAFARAQRGAAAAPLASSSVFPRWPTPACRSHASSGLDRR